MLLRELWDVRPQHVDSVNGEDPVYIVFTTGYGDEYVYLATWADGKFFDTARGTEGDELSGVSRAFLIDSIKLTEVEVS